MKTELITIEEIDVPALFGDDDKAEKLLADVGTAVTSIVVDPSTLKGRKEIASVAAKIPRLKTAIDGIGKDLVSEIKAKAKVIDSRRKTLRDGLDQIRVEFRQPLTDFEEQEKALVAIRENSINKLSAWLTDIQLTQDLDDLDRLLVESQSLHTTVDWGERQVEANEICDSITSTYNTKKTQLEEANRLVEENARLKREAEERAQKEREERIARESVEKARREEAEKRAEADRKAKAEREAEQQRLRDAEEAKLQAERDALEAQRREIEQAKQAELAAQAAKLAEIARHEQEEIRHEKELEAAAQAERDRIAEEKRKEEAEAAARAADKAHRAAINNRAVECMVEGGVSVTAAKKAVTLIAQGKVEAITITY